MKSILFNIITLFSIIASSCIKKDMPNPVPCLNPPCDTLVPIEDTFMVWQVPMLPDFTYGFSTDPIIIDDKFIFTNSITIAGEPIKAVSKLNGKIIWSNENKNSPQSSGSFNFHISNAKLAFWQYPELILLNINNGERLHTINFRNFPNGYAEPRMSGFRDWVFVVTNQYNENKLTDKDNLVRINIETLQMDTLFSLPYIDGYDQSIEPPGVTVNVKGDTLLIFQSRYYSPSTYIRHINFYCFNISKKKLEWLNKDIEETGIGAVYTPQIVGDRVYYQGSNEVFMFDIATGAKIWSRRFPGESYYLTKHIIAENKIFMYNDGVGLRALDLNSGLTIWENNDANYDGGLVGGLCYHNSNIYFIGGDEGYAAIFGLRADTGKQFWKYRTPNYKKYPKSTFGYINMISDPETGYLYTGDGVFMMCLKPPK